MAKKFSVSLNVKCNKRNTISLDLKLYEISSRRLKYLYLINKNNSYISFKI